MDQWAPSRCEGSNVRLEVSRSFHHCTAGMLEQADASASGRIGIATPWTGLSRAGVMLQPNITVPVPCLDHLPWITGPARAPRPAFTRPAFTIVFDQRRIVAYHRYSDRAVRRWHLRVAMQLPARNDDDHAPLPPSCRIFGQHAAGMVGRSGVRHAATAWRATADATGTPLLACTSTEPPLLQPVLRVMFRVIATTLKARAAQADARHRWRQPCSSRV